MRSSWLLAVGIVSLSWPALASGPDCSRANTTRDRLICQDATLSALNGQLTRLYERKRAMLSPHGADLLQRSEEGWLNYVDTICPMRPASGNDGRPAPGTCLEHRYKDRLTQLAQVALKLGPLVFNRIDSFAAEPDNPSDQSGFAWGFYIHHLAYPQIDNASSAAGAAWNKAYNKGDVSKAVGCDSGTGDTDTDYEIGYANQHITSIQWVDSTYCHGTPNGFFSVKTENRVWDQNARELTPADVFADGWQPKLQKLFWSALLAKGWKPDDHSEVVNTEIGYDVLDWDQWLFTKDGLSVSFGAYEGGCRNCTPGAVSMPWRDLNPLLAPASLVR